MKAILEFNLPEDQNDFEHAQKAGLYYSILFEVRNQLLRPARKHGFSDPEIQQLLEKLGDDGIELIHLLELKFNDLVVDVDDI